MPTRSRCATPPPQETPATSTSLYPSSTTRPAASRASVDGRYGSDGTGDYFHTVTRQQGQDGYDTIEWIAAQTWSNGRIGTVGSSYAGITQVRAALERPPHLAAIWPDVVPTNSFQHQSREGGAMQLHMFWALFIHAQDAQDIADDWDKQLEVWEDLKHLRELFWTFPFGKGELALRHTPTLERARQFLYDVCEPYLRIFRRVIPPLGPLDLSPIVGVIALYVLERLVNTLIGRVL